MYFSILRRTVEAPSSGLVDYFLQNMTIRVNGLLRVVKLASPKQLPETNRCGDPPIRPAGEDGVKKTAHDAISIRSHVVVHHST